MKHLSNILLYALPYVPAVYIAATQDFHLWWWASILAALLTVTMCAELIACEIRRSSRAESTK